MADPYGPHKSFVSLLAVAAAIASFFVHSGVIGLALALTAIVLGIIGFLVSFSPRVSGGILSLLANVPGPRRRHLRRDPRRLALRRAPVNKPGAPVLQQ